MKVRFYYSDAYSEALKATLMPYLVGSNGYALTRKEAAPVAGYDGLYAHSFRHCYVSERLGYRRVKAELPNCNPWFISAQTGAGKTSFVFDVAYRICKEQGKRLLILVSRSMLKTKVKYDAIEAAGTDQKETLTKYGIEQEHRFGIIDVYSYQDFSAGAQSEHNKRALESAMRGGEYGICVLDEVHYFSADSDFNASTEYSMKYLLELFERYGIARCYLTATPERILDTVYQLEQEIWARHPQLIQTHPLVPLSLKPFVFDLFIFERDYSYLNIIPFGGDEDLVQRIKESDNAKWVVFTDSKQRGYKLKAQIEKIGKSCVFLNSDNLHPIGHHRDEITARTVAKIADEESFETDVLITTKVLDAGVNIKEKNVNMVCFLTDRIDFVQAVGRKRVMGNERVNLFIPEYATKDVRRWISRVESRLEEFKENCKKYPNGGEASGTEIPMPIYVEKGRYRYNDLAFQKLYSQLDEYNDLLSKIENSDMNESTVIRQHILSWLELEDTYVEPGDEKAAEVLEIVNKYIGDELDAENLQLLMDELEQIGFDTRADKRSNRGKYELRTVNQNLKKYGFKVEGVKKIKGANHRIVTINETGKGGKK